MDRRRYFAIVVFVLLILFSQADVFGQSAIPRVTIGVDQASEPGDVAITLQILLLITVLSIAPAILVLMTSFTRIVIIFHFVRQAIGTQQMPSNQILIGLALFLTLFIMSPVIKDINDTAIQPYLKEEISDKDAMQKAAVPIRNFMMNLTREKDLALFTKLSGQEKPSTPDDLPMYVIIPAFVISEIRIAFQIGFILYVPFLMIDMIVASILMSMGMLMLPPVMISLPFKVLLFVLVDGWYLIVSSIVSSFH